MGEREISGLEETVGMVPLPALEKDQGPFT